MYTSSQWRKESVTIIEQHEPTNDDSDSNSVSSAKGTSTKDNSTKDASAKDTSASETPEAALTRKRSMKMSKQEHLNNSLKMSLEMELETEGKKAVDVTETSGTDGVPRTTEENYLNVPQPIKTSSSNETLTGALNNVTFLWFSYVWSENSRDFDVSQK